MFRCDTCDGFPCFLNAKSDADVNCVRPAIANQNVTLITQAKVLRLHTSASGREVNGVVAEIAGKRHIFSGDIVVLACGAINSAVLLLQSANDQHPNGLANSSNLVGRNYMAHKFGIVMALSTKFNATVFPKTIAVNDFYWGEKGFPFPMGSVQLLGNITANRVAAYAPPLTPKFIAEAVANHSVSWLLITEDLPNPNNRVYVKGEQIYIDYTKNNEQTFNRFMKRWVEVLQSMKLPSHQGHISVVFPQKMTLKEVGHQCGTCRFGEHPRNSVLDLNCRAHDVDNLYVVDGSFFPSSSAVNPSLTIMANALRVGEHLLARMGG